MIAPIATLIFATAMALSLSVEADSFFHTPAKATAEPSDDAEPANEANATIEASDDSTIDP